MKSAATSLEYDEICRRISVVSTALMCTNMRVKIMIGFVRSVSLYWLLDCGEPHGEKEQNKQENGEICLREE